MNATTERWKPSVTVAAVIHREVDGLRQYLLVEEHTAEGLKLNNPAGHLDPGESPLEAVVREAQEETACRFSPEALLGVYLSRFVRPATAAAPEQDVTYLRIAYAGTAGAPDPAQPLDVPIVRTLWLTVDEIRAAAHRHRSPLVMRCTDDNLAGRRYPLDAVQADGSIYQPEIKR